MGYRSCRGGCLRFVGGEGYRHMVPICLFNSIDVALVPSPQEEGFQPVSCLCSLRCTPVYRGRFVPLTGPPVGFLVFGPLPLRVCVPVYPHFDRESDKSRQPDGAKHPTRDCTCQYCKINCTRLYICSLLYFSGICFGILLTGPDARRPWCDAMGQIVGCVLKRGASFMDVKICNHWCGCFDVVVVMMPADQRAMRYGQ